MPVTSRCRVLPGIWFVLLWSAPLMAQSDAPQFDTTQPFDTVIAGGRVMDPESGIDATMNVGIRDGVIQALSAGHIDGRTTIEADGLVVAPGFIDLDSFTRLARFQVTDGVTTVFDIRDGTGDVNAWYERRDGKMPIHYGVGVGFRWVRHRVMQPSPPGTTDEPASDDQLADILRGVAEGLDQGAVAIGMGPGRFTYLNWELQQVLRLAANHQAMVVAPMRDVIWLESDVPANLAELIGAAKLTGASVHVPYLVSSGGPHTPRLLAMIAMAQDRGVDVSVEDYPYRGAVVSLDFDDDWLRTLSDEDLSDIYLVAAGRTVTRNDFETYRGQKVAAVILNRDIELFVAQSVSSPLTSIASHGYLDDELRGHPRTSGTYSRMLGSYVREQGQLTLMDALRKMSLMPAQRLQTRVPAMQNKGRVRVGADADLVIFNADTIVDQATYEDPIRPPRGIEFVLVDGVIVVDRGELRTGVLPGKAVRASN